MRGGEKCLARLCGLFPDSQISTLFHRRGATSEVIENRPIKTSWLQLMPGWQRYYRYLLPLFPRAVERLRVSECDLVLSLSHCVAKSAVPPANTPHVCYCFTPMRYAWHQREQYFGTSSLNPTSWLRNRILTKLRAWDRDTSHRVTHFIAISETVRGRIRECYQRDSEVIYPPVDTEFYRLSAAPREDYLLVVSAFAPYKRIDLAVAACTQLRRRLVVIGTGPDEKRIKKLAGPLVTFLGWQSDAEIRHHYQRCAALLFPGEEDFGIVPVEAQACGAPVIALARGGATETVRENTGLLYRDASVDGLIQAIEQFDSICSDFNPLQIRHWAEHFSAPRFDSEIRRFVDRILAEPVPIRRAA